MCQKVEAFLSYQQDPKQQNQPDRIRGNFCEIETRNDLNAFLTKPPRIPHRNSKEDIQHVVIGKKEEISQRVYSRKLF